MTEWGRTSGRRAPYPPDWKRRRRIVFARDNWTCIDCGWHDPTGATLECDHLGQPDDHALDHLATRCGVRSPNNCHGRKTSAAGNANRPRLAREPEPHPGVRRPA